MHRPLLLLALFLPGCQSTPDSPPSDPPSPPVTTSDVPTLDGPRPKHLILISVDSTRRDHLSRYDPLDRQLSPFLDARMNEGFVADAHRTCSNWTFHGMSCLLGGRYPIEAGFMPRVSEDANNTWPQGTPFLADFLNDAGYYTVLSSGNKWVSPDRGLGRGYDGTFLLENDDALHVFQQGEALLNQGLESGDADRWFLHLHLMDPHVPYVAPEEFVQGVDALDPLPWVMDDWTSHYGLIWDGWADLSADEQALVQDHLWLQYAAEIRWIDNQISTIWRQLEANGWLDDTLVVVANDHGEQFWERTGGGHAYTLYQEENDGFFFLWSANLAPGQTNRPSTQIDIVPTVLSLLDLPTPGTVSGTLLGESAVDRPLFAAADARLGIKQSVTVGDQTLLYDWNGSARAFDRQLDPLQQTDVFSSSNPDIIKLWGLLQPQIELAKPSVEAGSPTPPPGLSL